MSEVLFNFLYQIFGNLYAYCTDFIINIANILHISYYEANFIIFIVLFPLCLIGSCCFFVYQKIKYTL